MTLVLIYFTLAISLSFLCSVLEAVLLSTPISYINLKETEGANGAKLLRKLKTDIDKPISAILSLNTIAHTIGAAGVGAEAVKVFGEEYRNGLHDCSLQKTRRQSVARKSLPWSTSVKKKVFSRKRKATCCEALSKCKVSRPKIS